MDSTSQKLMFGASKSSILYSILSLNSVISNPNQWTTFSIASSGWLLIEGAGGGGGNRVGYGGVGGEGGYVKIPVVAGTNYRVWCGVGGKTDGNGATLNTDNSGYGAHGGAGGTGTVGTTGGTGGTPTILESTTNGTTWSLVAMAGAGGGGAQHINSAMMAGGGGGTWSAHSQANQLQDLGGGIYRNTVAGTFSFGGNDVSYLAGQGTSDFWKGSVGGTLYGVDANVLNQYFGGTGGNSNDNNPGGGGGGGYGGGSGGRGGGSLTTPGNGGYIQIGAVRWGGTGGGGEVSSNCGGGGGGGGSWYNATNYPGAGEKVGCAIAAKQNSVSSFGYGRTYRPTPLISTSVGYGGGRVEEGGPGGLIFLASNPF